MTLAKLFFTARRIFFQLIPKFCIRNIRCVGEVFQLFRCLSIKNIGCVRIFFNSFRCLCVRNIECITLSVVHASETLDVRIFFYSYQCLGIRNFGCAHLVNSLLDDRKQKARDRCVLSSCGLIVAQTETCTLSIINFLSHCIFKLKFMCRAVLRVTVFFFFWRVINIACVLCGCFTGESWLKTEKKT